MNKIRITGGEWRSRLVQVIDVPDPAIRRAASRMAATNMEPRQRRTPVTSPQGEAGRGGLIRPTPDRVRETLFNWLGQDLTGWRCLDLFAGTGILGFECASRGAASVTLVERDATAFARLKENAATFGAERLRPVRADALEFATAASQQGECYDLVLLDPPYRQGWLEKVAPLLPGLVRPGMWVYAEAEHRIETLGDWRTLKQGKAGQVFYHLLKNTNE